MEGKKGRFPLISSIETRIQAVNAKTLTPIVLRALGCTDGKLIEWTPEPMRPTRGNVILS